jgi:lipooligosaccharide transport system permease protein
VVFAPIVAFFAAFMFAALAMVITSFVRTINHFNFYFTGAITPLFFFSGIVFPLKNLPPFLQKIAEIFPLVHAIRWVRAISFNRLEFSLVWDALYIIVFLMVFVFLALKLLSKRLLD